MDRKQRPWWLWALAGLVALAALAGIILVVWKLPSLLYGDVTQASADARLQAASGFRTALVAGLAGLAALGSLAIANRTYRLAQQGQLTDRYTKAIEQLGSDKPDVRLGGIYALERIAKDSAQDGATIAEVLTAFIRGRAPWPPSRPDQPGKDTPIDDIPFLRYRAPDVQAALTVLGRQPSMTASQPLNLGDTDLRRADLTIRLSRSATCFFWPPGCWTMVTKSPAMALPSAAMGRLNPNWASSWGLAATATRAKSSPWSARKKLAGSNGKRLGSRGWPSMPSSKLNSISLLAAAWASGRT